MEYCHGRMPEDGTTKVTEPAAEKDQGLRADCYLADVLDLSRSSLQHDMEKGLVTKEGKPVKASYKVKLGDVFTVVIPPAVSLEAEPEPIPLAILYEDEDVIVVNKPRGMVVHPAAGNYTGTLVNALLYHCKDLSGINGVVRPGIVHRLDKDTSGVMVCAKKIGLICRFPNRSRTRKPNVHTLLLCGAISRTTGAILRPSSTETPRTACVWLLCLPAAALP